MRDQDKTTEELFRQLAPENQREVRDFIKLLIDEQEIGSRRAPRFDWAGALSDMRAQVSSVDLQHQLLDLRGDLE